MRRPVPSFLVIILFLLCNRAAAQGENNIWCFGEHQGLDFNAGPPVLYPSNIWTTYAAASVCDANGSLLFYSASISVFDQNGVVMPNGNGLSGASSATQGVATAMSVTNSNQYYLFTITTSHKLYYSVVDMTLNFNYGDVVTGQKNILLDSNISDKMIVLHGIACLWLLVHKTSTNEFHTFRIDENGINPNPVVSISGFLNANNAYMTGEMKASPDNTRLSVACSGAPAVELHSFNNVTGEVSNALMLDQTFSGHPFGTSFSPDGSKLYVSTNIGQGGVYQYDVSLLPDLAAVQNSKLQLVNGRYGSLRVGPDGKIYATHTSNQYTISTINSPNLAGIACDLVDNVFGPVLKGNAFETGLGSPAVVYCPPTQVKTDTTICLAEGPQTLSAPAGYLYYHWSDNIDTQTDTVSGTCMKWVYSYDNNNCNVRIDTFYVSAMSVDTVSVTNAKDTTVCFVNNIPILSASPGYNVYLWSDGFTQQNDTFSGPGLKWAYGQTGCSVHIDSFNVHAGLDTTWISLDTTLCVAYIPRIIVAPGGYTSYLWSDGTTSQTDTFMTSTSKWVRAQNVCMLLLDTIHFTATNVPQDSIFTSTTDSTICFEATPSLTVSAPTGYTDYLWSDGNQTLYNTFNSPGVKVLYAQKGCLALVDTFGVYNRATDTTIYYTDTNICFEKQTDLTAAEGYLSYLWNNGNSNQTNTITSTSLNWVAMHKACAERIDTFNVRIIDELSVNLGEDTAMCKGEEKLLDATSTYPDATYLWQNNSKAATYTATTGGVYWVTVSVGKCSISDTIRIQNKVLQVDLGNGTVPCGQDELVLDAGAKNSSYTWQDGSTERTFRVTNNGTYSVHVVDGKCSGDGSIDVSFEPCDCIVYIPNAFSPNNDGLNDQFGPTISCPINGYEFRIYNRWGNLVFHTQNLKERWKGDINGTQQDNGQFYYYIQFKDGPGHNYYYKGDVTIVE